MRYLLALLCLSVFLHGTMAAEFRPLILDANGKTKQFPNGTDTLRVVPTYGLAASVPAASADNTGQIYITTDTLTILRSNGTTWDSVTLPSGSAGGDLGGTYPNPDVLQASDDAFTIYDETDPTKGFNWTLGNQTTGTVLTLNTGAQSASRQLSVPVLAGNDTVAVIGQAQTFTGAQTFSTPIAPASGGTGVNNGSFALTVPATGTANLLGTAQTITAAKTHIDAELVLRNTDNTSAAATLLRLERGSGAGTDATIGTTGDTSNGVASTAITVNGSATSFASTGVTFAAPVIAPTATTSIPSIRMPHGVAPSAPTNGDVWTTTSGAFVRVNGATVGPLIDASSGGAVAAYYGKIASATTINITAGATATINRMHYVTGTSGNYNITLPAVSGNAGNVVGFTVGGYPVANAQYSLQVPDSATFTFRQATPLALVHGNNALLYCNGTDWEALALNLDTQWVDGGEVTPAATTTNPTKGTRSVDKMWWRRVGDSAQFRYEYVQSSGGTNGSGTYLIPFLFTADTGKINVTGTGSSEQPRNSVGSGQIKTRMANVRLYDATNVYCFGVSDGARGLWGSAGESWSGASYFQLEFQVPIVNW